MSCLSQSNQIVALVISTLLPTLDLEDGMQLRLVNRAFNEEVLHLYFIKGLKRDSFKGLWNPYWARLRLRAFFVTKQTYAVQHKQALDSFREAVNLLLGLPSWKGRWDSPATRPPTHFLDVGASSNSIFNDPAGAAVCDAVFYHHGACTISNALNSLSNPLAGSTIHYMFSKAHSEFWTFAAACVLGAVSLVREAALALQKNLSMPRDKRNKSYSQSPRQPRDEWIECLSECLYIPARLGHEDAIQLLLDLGANSNYGLDVDGKVRVSYNKKPIVAATKNGQKHIVQLLLHPSHGLDCSSWDYQCAIDDAASYPKLSTRRNLFNFFYPMDGTSFSLASENMLFRSACLQNDVTLTQSVLDSGAVNMADAFSRTGWGDTALSLAASRGHVESVQLILRTEFIPTSIEVIENAQWNALRAAVAANSMLVFRELVPYTKKERSLDVFTMAAAIDGGYSVMADLLLARVKLNTRFQGSTVGESGLVKALLYLRPQNVDFLLKQGVRVKRRVRVMRGEYRRSSHALPIIQDLLSQYDVPLLELP